MDGHRLDAIARRLAGRLSRRRVFGRGGAGLTAAVIGALGFARAGRAGQELPVCTDPDRPGVGCACTTGTANPCGETTLLCCQNDPNQAPGGPGTCTPASVGCNPTGPAGPRRPCTSRGCRCDGGVENACDDPLVCCPDNPGLPGGPGRCVHQQRCNPPGPCTSEGCACHSGARGACDGDLVCCADDPSQPGGPGRCEAEQVCFNNQCQATTNPCPSACASGTNCSTCCSGYCGNDGHCATPPCSGQGCECVTGTANPCDAGLVCCPNNPGIAGGPGTCVGEASCTAVQFETGDGAGTDDGGETAATPIA